MVVLNFDADQVDPMNEFDPVPTGEYIAVITGTEEKVTRKGDGKYLEFTFQIIEGIYSNRLVWTKLNLDNPNERTVQYARATLAAICQAVSVTKPKDSSELHNLPLVIDVTLKEYSDKMTNDIKNYSKTKSISTSPSTQNEALPWKKDSYVPF